MASKHALHGLIKWATREQWCDRFEDVFADHVMPACSETGLDIDDIVAGLGEDFFLSTVWACAFEDLLTREFGDGSNIVDDYLKRRGWKESASARAYMAALKTSVVSLYEVSDIVRDASFRARDLVRGGEPILVIERAATRFLKPGDQIAARIVQVASQTLISGAVLKYDHEVSKPMIEALGDFGKLTDEERRRFAGAIGEGFDDAALTDLSQADMMRALAPVITNYWLIDRIDEAESQIQDDGSVRPDQLRPAKGAG
jgi:hypothetical protein